jgi:hypothetical protein
LIEVMGVWVSSSSLEQLDELFNRHTGATDQRPEGFAVEFFMIGYGEVPPV